ncbi:hypothetical protein ABT247_33000 [Kitasatospora sp. NPDC001539]|uniref:hypothetical protein n=1 Tax=Kitasatospora sp. NPDC001539 TaxID=3154384 RepID=UPI0033251A14
METTVTTAAALVRKGFSIALLPTVLNSESEAVGCRFRSVWFVVRADDFLVLGGEPGQGRGMER